MNEQNNIFKNGSLWLRADFHLHTRADKEFIYDGEDNTFVNLYLDKLVENQIGIGAITNHNKFDLSEYKALVKKASKREIFLIPGVELSVNDGANGIHCLIIFDEKQWLENGDDYINQFLSATFAGQRNFQNENGRSNDNLISTIEKLDKFNKDYFIILAHIEQKSGFYEELKGGRISEFGKNKLFRKRVLGFQKVRTRDKIDNLNSWLKGELPAFVEGSDPKNINEIGRGEKTYLKIGAYNFTAIKYALLDYRSRLSNELKNPENGYIKTISFEGGKLDGTTIHLNNSMNNLIGIRGSGKSSILECIRYALDIELDENHNADSKYKNDLVNSVIGSGGKIICTFFDKQGNEYKTQKILCDRTNIYINDILQPGLRPSAIIQKPVYFGQKDLSKIGTDLSAEFFIKKLLGDSLREIQQKITEKNQQVVAIIREINKIDSKIKKKEEYEERKADLINKIGIFKKYNIDKKLEKQVAFNKDLNFIKRIKSFEKEIIESLDNVFEEYKSCFEEYKNYISKENTSEIQNVLKSFDEFEKIFIQFEKIISDLISKNEEIDTFYNNILSKFESLKEEFSKIKREINIPNIQADDYVKFTSALNITETQLNEIDKIIDKKIELTHKLQAALTALQGLWNKEFEIINKEVKKINADQKTIEIKVNYRGDKNSFKSFLKNRLIGSNIRDSRIEEIINQYADNINIYFDLKKEKSKLKDLLSENQFYTFKSFFKKSLSVFLTYRVPDKFEIIYKGRPLNEHSLGQRASALIIFLLTLKESDLIIIDQPEDDLDNQTIYNDVIKILKELKGKTQFIFATHNPNIPVLGDCEQIISCRYEINKINTNAGSIDNENIRDDIVNIMEGGEEAFNNRKRIYELWTH